MEAKWEYKPSGTATAEAPPLPDTGHPPADAPPGGGSAQWTASEYIDHDRSFGWYLMLLLGSVMLAGLIYLISRDWIGVGIVLALALATAFFVQRKPHQITYELNEDSIKIGAKSYAYNSFRSFSINRQADLSSVELVSLKRFMPPISMYFAAQDEEQIVSVLGAHLPYEEHEPSFIDDLFRHLKI